MRSGLQIQKDMDLRLIIIRCLNLRPSILDSGNMLMEFFQSA